VSLHMNIVRVYHESILNSKKMIDFVSSQNVLQMW
jgi:hypothetical protein